MLNLPYYNINGNNEYKYSYLLHILIRTTRLVEKGKVTRDNFIIKLLELGVSKRTGYRIWEKGAYKNKFIKYVSDNRDYLYITGKDNFETIIEKVPEYLYSKITGLNSLKDFLHYAYLGSVGINKKGISTGKGLKKIASDQKISVRTVLNKNKKCIKNFGLEKKNRFGVFNSLVIRLTNIYKSSIRIVKNKYCAVKSSSKIRINIINHFAPLFNALNFKTRGQKYSYAKNNDYEIINQTLFPKLI